VSSGREVEWGGGGRKRQRRVLSATSTRKSAARESRHGRQAYSMPTGVVAWDNFLCHRSLGRPVFQILEWRFPFVCLITTITVIVEVDGCSFFISLFGCHLLVRVGVFLY
jgi:hypothetical protein